MRQFISAALPDSRGNLVVSGKDFKYLHRVLRLQPGDVVHVRLPSGRLEAMVVTGISGGRLHLAICGEGDTKETGVSAQELETRVRQSVPPLWLLQFMPKPQKMDMIIRQATEVGVRCIVPIVGCRSQQANVMGREERWTRIIREARQQSGSPVGTSIHPPVRLPLAMEIWREQGGEHSCGLVLCERPGESRGIHEHLASVAGGGDTPSATAVVSGCEGGITDQEMELLQKEGFVPIHFNTNILRTETATLYGLSVIQNLLMEKELWLPKESCCWASR